MEYVNHEGENYPVAFPGSIMIGMLKDIGIENFEKFGSKDSTMIELAEYMSTIFYWGVKGGYAALGQHGKEISRDKAMDIVWPVMTKADGSDNIVAKVVSIMQKSMPQVPSDNGQEKKEPEEVEKKT